jgi:large subunit ribosomal protein L13
MKSFLAKKGEIEQKWLLVDAADQVLGRMAVKIARSLMGKTKPSYTPYTDVGDFVIVINAEKVKVTGKKAESKEYDHFTLHPGGHKYVSYAETLAKTPEKIIMHAVGCMMPKNKLGKQMMKKLKVYRGAEHEHQAQKPQKFEI